MPGSISVCLLTCENIAGSQWRIGVLFGSDLLNLEPWRRRLFLQQIDSDENVIALHVWQLYNVKRAQSEMAVHMLN